MNYSKKELNNNQKENKKRDVLNKRKRKLIWYMLFIILLPFLIMIFLRILEAIDPQLYFSINVKDIHAAQWFMFFGSYLGGVLTLVGVIITIQEERKIHRYQTILDSIAKEENNLGNALSKINVYAPSICYNEFCNIINTTSPNKLPNFSSIYMRIANEQKFISQSKIELSLQTKIWDNWDCNKKCKSGCDLPKITEDFRACYDKINKMLYETLTDIEGFIRMEESNYKIDFTINHYKSINEQLLSLGLPPQYTSQDISKIEAKKKNLDEKLSEIIDSIHIISEFNISEIQKLTQLSKFYIDERKDVAEIACFWK